MRRFKGMSYTFTILVLINLISNYIIVNGDEGDDGILQAEGPFVW